MMRRPTQSVYWSISMPETDIDGGVTNSGLISLTGPASGSALENQPVENIGVLVSGSGTMTGSILNSAGANIEVGGNASASVRVDGNMIGNVINDGTISTTGVEATAVAIYGDMVGTILNTGNMGGGGRDSIGLYVQWFRDRHKLPTQEALLLDAARPVILTVPSYLKSAGMPLCGSPDPSAAVFK